MKKTIIFIILIIICASGYFLVDHFVLQGKAKNAEIVIEEEDPAPPEPVRTEKFYVVQEGDVFTDVAEELGFSYEEALAIVDATAEVFDFTNVRLSKTLRVVSIDNVRTFLEYEPNKEDIVRVDITTDEYSCEIVPIPYDVTIERGEATIIDSMFLSGIAAGMSEVLILDLAETFAWEVDFATQVQEGDSFVVVYEKRSRGGEDAGVGRILVASFTNVGETVYAYRYIGADGEAGYYDAQGNSLIRPFLKAPLTYNRISSGYTYARFHPVTRTTSPHRAIDYAAPIGTPIKAVGDGVITFYGWNGGYGNYVDIRHNDTYQTQYAHLSKYVKGLKVGSRVKQGDVIGYVGSTGFSTGPHLHYQIKVNGTLVNPLEVEFPKGDPLVEDELEAFYRERDRLNEMLKGLRNDNVDIDMTNR